MKKVSSIYIMLAAVISLAGCSKKFLEEKRDFTAENEAVFTDPVLASNYVDYVYSLILPANNASTGVWNLATNSDAFARTTEELAGETNWNKQWNGILYTQAHALGYFGSRMPTSIANNSWTRIKQINLFLTEVDKYGMADSYKKPFKGQMYFWRAWQYFDLVRLYGGVPIIKGVYNPIIEDGNTDAQVPRAKTSECIKFICDDLDSAINNLPGKWALSADWGRITSGAAAALKGRVLLTWASPLFNRNDDKARWLEAYNANLAAKTLLEQNGFGLSKAGGTAGGTAFSKALVPDNEVNNPEAVIVYGFNNISTGNAQKNNGWENATRSKEILGGGSIVPTKEMVDVFPMADGKMPTDASGTYYSTYNLSTFYKNRDPRFYKTFVYTGAVWPYGGNATYRQWSYVWKRTTGANTYDATTETRGATSTGLYLCKANSSNASNSLGNFSISGTDYIELRFAEVVLNLAEAAIGCDKLGEGLEGIKSIRERAGLPVANNYGLGSLGGRDELFAAVLRERQIELAYEGKRFFDLRRWMLFESGPTATRLNFKPLNGTRRTGYFVSVRKAAGSNEDYVGGAAADPMIKPSATTNAPVVDRNPATYPSGITTYDQYVDYLYANFFKVTIKDNLESTTTTNWTFQWYPEYYFFGIPQATLDASTYLQQTIGWNSLSGAGTFDPLQ